jgi:type II restriction enzyme
MASLFAACAMEEASRHGNAILKFISPNEAGCTGSHQCGFYLPRSAWRMFTPHPPEKGRLGKHPVELEWPDGIKTSSVITWYGRATRAEYRLTRFGRDCPWLTPDTVGNLFMLVPRTAGDFACWIFDRDEDIAEIHARLGIEALRGWSVYQSGAALFDDIGDCIHRNASGWLCDLHAFPTGGEMSSRARALMQCCTRGLAGLTADELLMRCFETEYRLFRLVEHRLCSSELGNGYRDIGRFLATASSVLNRRKARAGRSLENHFEFLLQREGIPHRMRPSVDGEPDVVIPGEAAYRNPDWPDDKLFIVGIKTTCKDRWRQVLNEGRRTREKYIVTLQPGISSRQMQEMNDAGITLVVPAPLHREYPAPRPVRLLSVQEFIAHVRAAL